MSVEGLKVLVTGGAGFVPSHVADAFLARGASVTAVDDLSAGRRSNLDAAGERINFVEMDVRDPWIGEVIADHDVVVHMAANADVPVSVERPDYDFDNNVLGGYRVLSECLKEPMTRIVFASSAAVYGEPKYTPMDESHPLDPTSPYGAAKLAIERLGMAYHRSFGLPFTAVRIFNTYGPRQPRYVMYDLIRKLLTDPSRLEVLGTGRQIRDYAYVDDTAALFVAAAEQDAAIGECYNVAGGNPVSIRDLATRLVEILGTPRTEITFTGRSWAGDITTLSADISKARRELSFEPKIDVDHGIGLLVDWMRSRGVVD